MHQEKGDFTRDGATLLEQDHVLNAPDGGDTYQFASACVHTLRTNTAHTFTNRYWSNNGAINTYSKESVIHALRFKSIGTASGGEETN